MAQFTANVGTIWIPAIQLGISHQTCGPGSANEVSSLRDTRDQFDKNAITRESQLFDIGACGHPTAPGSPTEVSLTLLYEVSIWCE